MSVSRAHRCELPVAKFAYTQSLFTAEEARKLGVLEKCFVHIQPPYVPEDEAVRVFVVFSGLVGAWNAVKAFDGRYFGGRNVKAKFYNEQALELGKLHL